MTDIPDGGARVIVIVESEDGHYTEVRRVGQLKIGLLLAMCLEGIAEARDDHHLGAVAVAAGATARRWSDAGS